MQRFLKHILRDKRGDVMVNPFLHYDSIETKPRLEKVSDTNYVLVDTINDTVEANKIVFAKQVDLDKAPFFKTFKEGIAAMSRANTSARDVLIFILANKLRFNDDMFEFIPDEYMRETGIGLKTVERAIRSLKELEIILEAKPHKHMYFINFYMFFKGERRWMEYKYNIHLNEEIRQKAKYQELELTIK